jgi:RNA methyltransferase, TrmH family
MAHSTLAKQRHVMGSYTGSERRELITSRENRWLKTFRAVLRGKGPQSGQPIGVEGRKMVEDALRAGLEAQALLLSEFGERDAEQVLRAARECQGGIVVDRILRTTDKLFESVAGTETPQRVAALFRPREWTLEDVLRGPKKMREAAPLVVVLAAVQDPGNVGTAVRSAEAFGATGVVATRGTADPWSPKALRASAGSALRLAVLRGMAIPILITQLKIAGVQLYAAASARDTASNPGEISPEADLSGSVAIFIGNEGTGLPPEVTRSVDQVISIATGGEVESLNAAIAASILLYEAARQRRAQSR